MIVESKLWLDNDELEDYEWRRLFRALTITTQKAQIEAYRITNKEVILPRGAWNLLPEHVEYEDRRIAPDAPEWPFTLTLDSEGFSGHPNRERHGCVTVQEFARAALFDSRGQ